MIHAHIHRADYPVNGSSSSSSSKRKKASMDFAMHRFYGRRIRYVKSHVMYVHVSRIFATPLIDTHSAPFLYQNNPAFLSCLMLPRMMITIMITMMMTKKSGSFDGRYLDTSLLLFNQTQLHHHLLSYISKSGKTLAGTIPSGHYFPQSCPSLMLRYVCMYVCIYVCMYVRRNHDDSTNKI